METDKANTSKGKILIIKGQSQYNVLRYASDLIAKGFEENGYQVVIFDGLKKDITPNEISDEMKDNGKLIFSYNALLHDFSIDGNTSIYDQLGYPTLGYLVDHPYYHKGRLKCSHGNTIFISVVDYDHVDYIKSFYPEIKHVTFLPHFSFQCEYFIPYAKRSIDIYYPGSYKNPDDFNQNLNMLPDIFQRVSVYVFNLILNNPNLTLEHALKSYFTSIKFEYSSEEFMEIINKLFFVDQWVRNYRRDKIIRTILDAGINITVSGKGWEHLESIYKGNLQVIGRDGLDIEENIRQIADSKILINTFPEFKNGTHERIFTAMINGCVCLTDASGYTLEHFQNYEHLVYYNLDNIHEIPNIILDLLNNPMKAEKIAQNASLKASTEYSVKNNAKRILDVIGLQ